MIGFALALALIQAPADSVPTVGDTVLVTRPIAIPAGAVVRPSPFPTSALADPLGVPRISSSEGRSVVEYPLVFWRPGVHAVDLPGVVLILADGRADTLPSLRVTVKIGTVLPDRAAGDSAPAPQPPATVLARADRSPQPIVVLLVLVVSCSVPLHLWWRKRGPSLPPTAGDPARPVTRRLVRWREQGETRAALDGWRAVMGGGGTEARQEERAALLAEMDAVRYAPPDVGAEAVLCDRMAQWTQAERGDAPERPR